MNEIRHGGKRHIKSCFLGMELPGSTELGYCVARQWRNHFKTCFPEDRAQREDACYVTVFTSLFFAFYLSDEIFKLASVHCTRKHANLANLLL